MFLLVLLLLLLLLLMLVAQHVCTHCTCDETAYGAQRTSAHLVAQKCTTSTSYEGRA